MKSEKHDIMKKLRDAGVQPSNARIRILEYLEREKNHPTADQLYNALLPQLPTLSRTTVYNSVSALEQGGLIRSLSTDGLQIRYDANTADHGHFGCLRCGIVFDFEADLSQVDLSELDEFSVYQRDLIVKGLCPACKNSGSLI